MRATPLLLFSIALQVCFSIAANAANAPTIGPQANAEQVRAARPETVAATRLVFDEQRDGATPTVTTVVIADDFLQMINGTRETIYDFKLKRVISIDSNTRRFSGNSLYAAVAFRAFERRNRSMLGATLRGGALPDALKPFWVESQLGITDPTQPRPAIETQKSADGSLSFRFEGTEVVRFVPSAQAVLGAERSRFARASRYFIQVHPMVLDQILATGLVPGSLTYVGIAGPTKVKVTLTLRSIDRLDVAFPLPADFASEVLRSEPADTLGTTLNGIVPQMLLAVATQYGTGPRSIADYRTMIGDAVNRGDLFQAVLLEFELMLQHGQQSVLCADAPATPRCYSIRDVAEAARGDARAQAFLQALEVEARNPSRAIELRQGIGRTGLSNTAALDIMLANTLSQSAKHGDALPLFVAAIRANPYVASFYKDIGDHFLRDYRMDLAWLCFDLGRMLPGADATGNFQAVDQLEQQLASQNPLFF
jgi:hypothetical protein